MRLVCDFPEVPAGVPLYVFGAGEVGKALLSGLIALEALQIDGVIDNFRNGSLISVPILSWEAFLAKAGPDDVVLLAVRQFEEVLPSLGGFPAERVLNAFPLALSLMHMNRNPVRVPQAEQALHAATRMLQRGQLQPALDGYRRALQTLLADAWGDEGVLLGDLLLETLRGYQDTGRLRPQWEKAARNLGHLEAALVPALKHYNQAVASAPSETAPCWAPPPMALEAMIPCFRTPAEVFSMWPGSLPPKRDDLQARLRDLKVEFRPFERLLDTLGDASPFHPEQAVAVDGRLLSPAFLASLRPFLRCLGHLRPGTICEVGARHLELAQLWLTNPVHRPQRYILVDGPAALFFAEVYFRTVTPSVAVRYHFGGALPDLLPGSGPELLLCPIDQARGLEALTLDLVIDIQCIQNLNMGNLGLWHDWLERQACGHFYSQHLFGLDLEQAGELLPGCAPWAPALPVDWRVCFQKVTRLQPSTLPVAERLAERAGPPGGVERAALLSFQEATRHRLLEDGLLLELLDGVRRCPEEGRLWDLLQRCLACPGGVPGEARWLHQTLAAVASKEFLAAIEPQFERARIRLAGNGSLTYCN